jgi:hypothetical protein
MAFDVNKLLQKMQDQTPKAKSGKGAPAGTQPKQQQQQDGPSKKRQREESSTKPAPPLEQKPQAVAAPATPAGEGKRAKKSKKKAAVAAVMADSPASRPSEHSLPVASTSRSTTTTQHEAPQVVRHSAPSLTVVGSTLTGSTKKGSVQDKLRAQLAGGKFRMLNEQLYTTSGDDAHRLMKEDGAFDDVSFFFSPCALPEFLPAVLPADHPHTTRAVSHWIPLTSCYVAGPPARLDCAIPVERPAAQFPHCRLWLRRRRARSHSLPAPLDDVAEYTLAAAADPVAQGARESRQDEAAQGRLVRPREPVELRCRGRVLVGPAAGRSRWRRDCRRGGVLSELDGDGLDPHAPRSAPGAQGRVSCMQGCAQLKIVVKLSSADRTFRCLV